MPKKRKADEAIGDLFAPTSAPSEPAAPTGGKPERQKTRSIGVTLKGYEIDELAERAENLGISRNALTVWLIRHGLAALREGEIKPEFESVRVLKEPE
jgi:hypothetical protein